MSGDGGIGHCGHHWLIGLWLFALIAWMPKPTKAQQIGIQTLSAALDRDPRLDQIRSVQASGVTCNELLHGLSNKDLTLISGRSCAEQKIQIRLKKRTLRCLMRALAELLPATWEPLADKSGYRLNLNDDVVLSTRRWWQLYEGEWENTKAQLRELVLKQMRSVPKQSVVKDKGPDGTVGVEHGDPVQMSKTAEQKSLFNMLPPALQETIADRVNDYALYTSSWTNGANEGAVSVPLTDLPDRAQQIILASQTSLLEARPLKPEDLTVLFRNQAFIVGMSILLPDGETFDSNIATSLPRMTDVHFLPLEHPWIVDQVRKLGREASPTWKVLAAYQARRVWANRPAKPAIRKMPPPARAEELSWLGEHTQAEFVADFYSCPCSQMSQAEKNAVVTVPIEQVLDTIADEHDCSWKKTGDDLYLVRNNRWYRDDNLEVPKAVIQQGLQVISSLQSFAKRKKPATNLTPKEMQPRIESPPMELMRARMDWFAQLANNLSAWQVTRGLVYTSVEVSLTPSSTTSGAQTSSQSDAALLPQTRLIFPFVAIALQALKEWRLSHFYAGLSLAQRDAIWSGQLSFAALTPQQQSDVVYLVPQAQGLTGNRTALLGMKPSKLAGYLSMGGTVNPEFELHLVVNHSQTD